MEQARAEVTAQIFGAPRFRRLLLKAMKDNTHPEPAGEHGDDPGDEAGNDGDTECIHGEKINLPTLEFAAGIVDHNRFTFGV
jgi:hypothetical protein